jgi:chromosome segregation ATPase
MQSLVINEEDNSIKELMHTSVINEEKILNLKTDVIYALEDIRMEPGNGIYIEFPVEVVDNLEYTSMCTLDELEKLQNKDMLLLQNLDQSNNHEEQEQKIHLKDKEEEINRLKTKFVDLTKEMNELKAYDTLNKCTEELEETKEMINNLKTQLEESKESEETLKIQLTKKEESCHTLELEVINLKRIQLENKEEIKRLKTEVVDLTK